MTDHPPHPDQPQQPHQPGQQPYPPQQPPPGQPQQPQHHQPQPGQPPHPGQQPPPQQNRGGVTPTADDAKSFFAALLDFKFHTMITPMVVKFVYMIGFGLICLFWLIALISGFATGEALAGIFVLLVGPIIALIYLAFFRMTLELYFAVVRMSDDIHRTYNPNG